MPDKFVEASVLVKANVYFDGKVSSRVVFDKNGKRFTLGVICPGSYQFDVGAKEIVDITAGEAQVQLPGEDWKTVKTGDTFIVGPDCDYRIRCYEVTEYLCAYVD